MAASICERIERDNRQVRSSQDWGEIAGGMKNTDDLKWFRL